MAGKYPPGPRGHWLLGHLPDVQRDRLGFFTRCRREFGDVAGIRIANRRAVLVSDPRLIEQILVADNRKLIKNFALTLLEPLLGQGLLLNEGDSWLRQRRIMQPAFSRQKVESYGACMVDFARRQSDAWIDGETRDLHAEMAQLTMQIAAKTLFDVEMEDEGHAIRPLLRDSVRHFLERFNSPVILPYWLPTPLHLRSKRTIRELDAIIQHMIDQRRNGAAKGEDLLSALIRARDENDGRGMTDKQLRDEVTTLFLAGHDTTANALAWTWYLLARHPQAQRRVQAELADTLAGREPSVADLPRLVECEHVVKEAMRLFPPAYTVGRRNLEPLEIGGYTLPPGVNILASQWVVHRDERWFPSPDEFRPERWGEPTIAQLPKYAYFPFGGGARVCIGNTFAMLEATLIVATIAQRFEFSQFEPKEIAPQAAITLSPAEPLELVVRRRAALPEPVPRAVAAAE
jgi:cytochrome P450